MTKADCQTEDSLGVEVEIGDLVEWTMWVHVHAANSRARADYLEYDTPKLGVVVGGTNLVGLYTIFSGGELHRLSREFIKVIK